MWRKRDVMSITGPQQKQNAFISVGLKQARSTQASGISMATVQMYDPYPRHIYFSF